jgi:hypothetical protein
VRRPDTTSLTVGPREHPAPAPAASIGVPKDSEPNFLEPMVQSPWQYLPTTGDMDELVVGICRSRGNCQPRPNSDRYSRDDAFPSLSRARQTLAYRSALHFLKSCSKTATYRSSRFSQSAAACANRQAKQQYLRWFMTRVLSAGPYRPSNCAHPCASGVGALALGLINHPVEEEYRMQVLVRNQAVCSADFGGGSPASG